MAGFKSEVVKAQELHLASLMRDTERLTSNLGQIRSEIRCSHWWPTSSIMSTCLQIIGSRLPA